MWKQKNSNKPTVKKNGLWRKSKKSEHWCDLMTLKITFFSCENHIVVLGRFFEVFVGKMMCCLKLLQNHWNNEQKLADMWF